MGQRIALCVVFACIFFLLMSFLVPVVAEKLYRQVLENTWVLISGVTSVAAGLMVWVVAHVDEQRKRRKKDAERLLPPRMVIRKNLMIAAPTALLVMLGIIQPWDPPFPLGWWHILLWIVGYPVLVFSMAIVGALPKLVEQWAKKRLAKNKRGQD